MAPPVSIRRALTVLVLAFSMISFSLTNWAATASPELKPGHPTRYTVQKGDTLWGIAGRFLRDPWRWPEIWQRNTAIDNPHLIYPGDVLVLNMVNGSPELRVLRRKVVKLSPAVYTEPLDEAIPTIPPNAIQAFLTSPLVIEEDGLKDAGYVAIGLDGKIALGMHSVMYARGLPAADTKFYRILRPGKRFFDPLTKEFLGQQAEHVGDARLLTPGETAKLEIIRSHKEVSPGDRMLPAPSDIGLPYYTPHAPEINLRGFIIDAPGGVAEVGPYSVVVVSVGTRENIEPGHVLRIMRDAGVARDPVTRNLFKIPEEESGLLMVFRTFEKVSYALVMEAVRPVHVLDIVETP